MSPMNGTDAAAASSHPSIGTLSRSDFSVVPGPHRLSVVKIEC
jgi:hypothetical protein